MPARRAWGAQISLLQPATMSSSEDLSFLELRYLKTNVCINIHMSAFSVCVLTFYCYCAVCLFIFAGKARSDSEPAASSQKSFIPPSLVNPQRPEEDILFQWRLRRKMEQARGGPWHMQHTRLHGPTVTWQTPTLNHPPATGPLLKVDLHVSQTPFCFIFQICRMINFSLVWCIVSSTSKVHKRNTQHSQT